MMQARIYSDDFNRLVDATKAFVSTRDVKVRIFQKYIKLNFDAEHSRVTAVAVDGYRLSVEHATCNADEDFYVYIKPTLKLPKGQYVTITLDENEAVIRGADYSFGFYQPQTEEFDYEKVIPTTEKRVFRIGFNGNYLLDALKAAKVSSGDSLRKPVVIEFFGETAPALIRTNGEDIKMVLPVRIME